MKRIIFCAILLFFSVLSRGLAGINLSQYVSVPLNSNYAGYSTSISGNLVIMENMLTDIEARRYFVNDDIKYMYYGVYGGYRLKLSAEKEVYTTIKLGIGTTQFTQFFNITEISGVKQFNQSAVSLVFSQNLTENMTVSYRTDRFSYDSTGQELAVIVPLYDIDRLITSFENDSYSLGIDVNLSEKVSLSFSMSKANMIDEKSNGYSFGASYSIKSFTLSSDVYAGNYDSSPSDYFTSVSLGAGFGF